MADDDDKTTPPEVTDQDLHFGDELPVLPIRNAVLFPGAVAPFDVGREKVVSGVIFLFLIRRGPGPGSACRG